MVQPRDNYLRPVAILWVLSFISRSMHLQLVHNVLRIGHRLLYFE